VWAIVVAGGAGRRFGEPKQFAQLAGRPVAVWSVDAARSVADGVVLVVPGDTLGSTDGAPADADRGGTGIAVPDTGADRVVAGGTTRSDSVRAGLAAVPDDADIIVVHDAARPLATAALFAAVVAAVRSEGADAAIPVLPVADTVKRVEGATVRSTVDRDGLVAVQTPQAFVAATLRSAHGPAGQASDDAALVESWGATVQTVAGEPHNLKLTRPEDLLVAEALIGVIEEADR
jgi:2-C-methyl-D-erythritol 4-phosphate cytidylyltransferase